MINNNVAIEWTTASHKSSEQQAAVFNLDATDAVQVDRLSVQDIEQTHVPLFQALLLSTSRLRENPNADRDSQYAGPEFELALDMLA